MSLSQQIADAPSLGVLDATYPAALVFEDAEGRLALNVTAQGPVGLAFDRLEFTAADRAERAPKALRAWADRLASKLTYLMEPLVVVEIDPLAGEAELRSESPTPRGDLRAYYEVVLHKSAVLRLSRVVFDEATRRRRPADCQLTVEVLERLADDLVACAS